jgi:hypothetical protein
VLGLGDEVRLGGQTYQVVARPIFALPPAELAVHPADGGNRHELYLMCDDIVCTLAELKSPGVEVTRDISDQGGGCSPESGYPTARS